MVAEWPPFEKLLPARLAIVLIVFCLFVLFMYFPFWHFGGRICLLIAPVLVHCFSIILPYMGVATILVM